jgi:dynein light intermediate chain
MTIASYETMYESSVAYGIRKALMAEQKRTDLELKIRQLDATQRELVTKVETMKATIDAAVAKAAERRDTEEKIHIDDVERISRTNEQLKSTLEAMLSAPKK